MGTTVPYDGPETYTDPTTASDLLLEAYAESELDDLAEGLGVELAAFAGHLLDESAEDRLARISAASDMLADDPGIYTRLLRALDATRRWLTPDPALPAVVAAAEQLLTQPDGLLAVLTLTERFLSTPVDDDAVSGVAA